MFVCTLPFISKTAWLAKFSDAIILIGGGEGVEHLAQLNAVHNKPVLPLDIPVGSSCDDGRGGASYLYESFVSNPEKFIPDINDKLRTQSSFGFSRRG